MRISGLPCRAEHYCEAVFKVVDQASMASLHDAVAERDAHELSMHNYTHVVTTTLGPSTFAKGPRGPRGRRRREPDEVGVG